MQITALVLCLSALGSDEVAAPIAADRTLQVIAELTPRLQLFEAGEKLGDWTIWLAGVEVDGPWLQMVAESEPTTPFVRVVREAFGRPIDLDDLVFFLDDVLVAGDGGRSGEDFMVHAGRARAAGILIHPDDVFKDKPRIYGVSRTSVSVDGPKPQQSFPTAVDDEQLGPNWTMRYRNPDTRNSLYETLAEARPKSGFTSRVAALLTQLEAQGAEVYLTSTARSRHRGYLMWGAFILSRQNDEAGVKKTLEVLAERNESWNLNTPITWSHPDGWEATVEAARVMADTYDVVYATERGARKSNHYDGVAADFVAFDLPAQLRLVAPDGEEAVFDLSDPDHPRDLSLSPELITWVAEHFSMKKLKSDYPHWNDAG